MKKAEPKPLAIILLFALISFNNSCTTILKARFESDLVGGQPNTGLPGAPTGDMLQATEPMMKTMLVISESIEGSKALQFSNLDMTAIGGPTRWVGFKAKEANLNKPITFSWAGKVVPSGNTIMFDLGLTSRSRPEFPTTIVRLNLEDNGVLNASPYSFSTGFATKLPIGNVGQGVHTIMVTLNAKTKKFGVTLYPTADGGSRSPITISGDILVSIDALNFENNRPAISLGFDGSGSSSPRKYLIDDLTIWRRND
jgi:hypothetical protein